MTDTLILFPEESFSGGKIDSEFPLEEESARSVGFATCLYDHESLQSGSAIEALVRVTQFKAGKPAILRGWTVLGEVYAEFYSALEEIGYHPINAPEDYEQAHYIP